METQQQKVDAFMKKMGWQYFDTPQIIAKIKEELRELEEAIESGEKLDVELEYGDLLFALSCFANKEKINQNLALTRSMQKFGERDKDRYPEGK